MLYIRLTHLRGTTSRRTCGGREQADLEGEEGSEEKEGSKAVKFRYKHLMCACSHSASPVLLNKDQVTSLYCSAEAFRLQSTCL